MEEMVCSVQMWSLAFVLYKEEVTRGVTGAQIVGPVGWSYAVR